MSYDDFQRWVGTQAAKSPVKSAWFTALAAGLIFGVCEGALNGSWVATRGRVFLAIVPIGCTAFLFGAVSRHDIPGVFVWFVCGMLGLLRARKLPTAWRHNIERARTAATYAQRMSVKDLA